IENLLTGTGFIDQTVVLGYKRKFCSALIVPSYDNISKKLKSRGTTVGEDGSSDPEVRKFVQQVVDNVNKDLSPWETVKKFVLVEPFTIASGELTPTHKVKRPKAKEHYEEEINSMYEEEERDQEEE